MTTHDSFEEFEKHLESLESYVPDPETMQQYPVSWKRTVDYTATVWANSPTQARQIVQNDEHGEWETLGDVTEPFDIKVGAPRSSHKLENSDQVLHNVHTKDECKGEYCTIHKMSDHHMRSWPQYWRADWGFMERVCPHGIGHPDPDEYLITIEPHLAAVHGCDGCCIDKGT